MILLALLQSAFIAIFWTTAMVIFFHLIGDLVFLSLVTAGFFAIHFLVTLIQGRVFGRPLWGEQKPCG